MLKDYKKGLHLSVRVCTLTIPSVKNNYMYMPQLQVQVQLV